MQDLLNINFPNNDKDFFLKNGLYVVATPIGNMLDVTFRAIDILKKCDFVVCEDSRVSSRFLGYFGIKKSFIIYNDHSLAEDRREILDLIKNQNKALCLISDAGTPLISDPGYKLVSFLLDNNVEVKSVPGACSAIAALSISGIESDRFLFAGFIPNSSQREVFLREFVNINSTLIFFESAQRLASSLSDMLRVFGNRKAAVAREITKLFEEVKKDDLKNLIEFYSQKNVKGEIVILISRAKDCEDEVNLSNLDSDLLLALKNMKPKDAVSLLSLNYNLPKKEVYQRMLDLLKDEK